MQNPENDYSTAFKKQAESVCQGLVSAGCGIAATLGIVCEYRI